MMMGGAGTMMHNNLTQGTKTDSSDGDPYNLKDGEVSSGTSLCAIPFKGGVVLTADSRTSMGSYVANRFSDKIVQISDYIWALRSGSAADTQALTDYVKYYVSQYVGEAGRQPMVKTVAHLLKTLVYNNPQLSAGIIIGGWDSVDGGSVYNVLMGGSCLKMPFAVGGSGSLYIYGLLDSEFREDMSMEEAKALAQKGISHAIARDGSSGGLVRSVVVTQDGFQRDVILGNQLPFGPSIP